MKLLIQIFLLALSAQIACGDEFSVRLYQVPRNFADMWVDKADVADFDPFSKLPAKDPLAHLLVKNKVQDVLPGKVYDLKGPLSKKHGVLNSSRALAWMNPESSVLIIRGDDNDHRLMDSFISAIMWEPTTNLKVSGRLIASTGKPDAGETSASWEILTEFGKSSKVQFLTEDGIGMEAEIATTVNNDGFHINFQINASAKVGEDNYSIDTSFITADGQTKVIRMGVDAPDSRKARLELEVNKQLATSRAVEIEGREKELIKKLETLLPAEG